VALADDSQHSSIWLHHVEIETTSNEAVGQLAGACPDLDHSRSVGR
jgi:hypothetical protein